MIQAFQWLLEQQNQLQLQIHSKNAGRSTIIICRQMISVNQFPQMYYGFHQQQIPYNQNYQTRDPNLRKPFSLITYKAEDDFVSSNQYTKGALVDKERTMGQQAIAPDLSALNADIVIGQTQQSKTETLEIMPELKKIDNSNDEKLGRSSAQPQLIQQQLPQPELIQQELPSKIPENNNQEANENQYSKSNNPSKTTITKTAFRLQNRLNEEKKTGHSLKEKQKDRFIPPQHTIFENEAEEEEKVQQPFEQWNEANELSHKPQQGPRHDFEYVLIIDTSQPKDTQQNMNFELIQFNAVMYELAKHKVVGELHCCLKSQGNREMPFQLYSQHNLEVVYSQTNKITLFDAIQKLRVRFEHIDPSTIVTATFNCRTYRYHLIDESREKRIELPNYLYRVIELNQEWKYAFDDSQQFHEIAYTVGGSSNHLDSYETTNTNCLILQYLVKHGFEVKRSIVYLCYQKQAHDLSKPQPKYFKQRY